MIYEIGINNLFLQQVVYHHVAIPKIRPRGTVCVPRCP
jgi:hypothetical protein